VRFQRVKGPDVVSLTVLGFEELLPIVKFGKDMISGVFIVSGVPCWKFWSYGEEVVERD
jgi:hypothetical protein